MSAEHSFREQVERRLAASGWRSLVGTFASEDMFISCLPRSLETFLIRSGLGSEDFSVRDIIKDITSQEKAVSLGNKEFFDDVEKQKGRALRSNELALRKIIGKKAIKGMSQQLPLVDLVNVENNIFEFTHEVSWTSAVGKRIRVDLICWVNGIPLVIAEFKGDINDSLDSEEGKNIQAISQLEGYLETYPEAFTTSLFSIAAKPGSVRYGDPVSMSYDQWLTWSKYGEDKSYLEIDITDLLDPERIIKWLSYQLFFHNKSGKKISIYPSKKIIPRQNQVEAVEKIVERFEDSTRFEGLVQQHQGSGKSLIMYLSAQLALDRAEARNNSDARVIFLVDRSELRAQLKDMAYSLEDNSQRYFYGNSKTSESDKVFAFFKQEEAKASIITIQSFNAALGKSKKIKPRSASILLLCDEAHRSQTGEMADKLRASISKGTFIGLTGTPISEIERSTYRAFSHQDDQPDGRLHRYTMKEAEDDGFVVDIELLEKPIQLKGYKKGAQKELDKYFAGSDPDIFLSEIKKINNHLSDQEVLREVTRFVASDIRDFKESTGLKSMLIVSSRPACVTAYRLLEQEGFNSKEMAIVMTPGEGGEQIKTGGYTENQLNAYATKEAEERDIRTRFLDHDNPLQLLIVTKKLLTGFDAPILGKLYFAKLSRQPHDLFQAVTRVNRSLKPIQTENGLIQKDKGQVIFFLPLRKHMQNAVDRIENESYLPPSGSEERRLYNFQTVFTRLKSENEQFMKAAELNRSVDRGGKAIALVRLAQDSQKLWNALDFSNKNATRDDKDEAVKIEKGLHKYLKEQKDKDPSREVYLKAKEFCDQNIHWSSGELTTIGTLDAISQENAESIMENIENIIGGNIDEVERMLLQYKKDPETLAYLLNLLKIKLEDESKLEVLGIKEEDSLPPVPGDHSRSKDHGQGSDQEVSVDFSEDEHSSTNESDDDIKGDLEEGEEDAEEEKAEENEEEHTEKNNEPAAKALETQESLSENIADGSNITDSGEPLEESLRGLLPPDAVEQISLVALAGCSLGLCLEAGWQISWQAQLSSFRSYDKGIEISDLRIPEESRSLWVQVFVSQILLPSSFTSLHFEKFTDTDSVPDYLLLADRERLVLQGLSGKEVFNYTWRSLSENSECLIRTISCLVPQTLIQNSLEEMDKSQEIKAQIKEWLEQDLDILLEEVSSAITGSDAVIFMKSAAIKDRASLLRNIASHPEVWQQFFSAKGFNEVDAQELTLVAQELTEYFS